MKINYIKENKARFQLQTESRLHKVLCDIFSRSSFNLGDKQVFVNVVFVDLSKDLKNAKVVLDSFGLEEKDKKTLLTELNKHFIGQVRGLIAQKLRMKYIPDIRFFWEERKNQEEKINKILEEEAKNFTNDGE